jgi:N-acetylglucosaminyldiphosphoundecaprenol N-acetyl-beta-D-mannosaminyltransferase
MQPSAGRDGHYVIEVFIDAISWNEATVKLLDWAAARESRYVCLCNVHVVVTACQDTEVRGIVNSADMATPDGMPVAWVLRLIGFSGQERINGPDLMVRVCRAAAEKRVPVFFYGSRMETLEKLRTNLKNCFPKLEIAGAYSPPFRALAAEEDHAVIDLINSSEAGIVFVGLGCPKQEQWMADHRGKINAVMLGVGAAFDFHAGTIKRAPKWMQKVGIEWFHRFLQEPRRLWKRYAITNSLFIWLVLKEFLSKKRHNA